MGEKGQVIDVVAMDFYESIVMILFPVLMAEKYYWGVLTVGRDDPINHHVSDNVEIAVQSDNFDKDKSGKIICANNIFHQYV